MAVTLYVLSAKGIANVYDDALAGGGTGIDFGQVTSGSFAPIVDKDTNDGYLPLYLTHDAELDPITNLKVYLDSFASTGFTYGGAESAASDYAQIKAQGNLSGNSKNNADGNSGGLWMDMDYDVSTANQFDQATRSTQVKIFGDNTTDGIDAASAFTIISDAMLHSPDNLVENAPSAPVNGKIGVTADTILGNYAKLRFRTYLRSAFADGGIFQAAITFRFSYTA
jgi:hypothetical protein